MMRINLAILFLFTVQLIWGQDLKSPVEKRNFSSPTTYNELTDYIHFLDGYSDLLTIKPIGTSVQGRTLNALLFSSGSFATDTSKLKILIFAQQHGNEQSGKEGALLLAQELVKPENEYLLKILDIAIIPQVNPDGAEVNKRRNANGTDLNRSHLILFEPELIALHQFFDAYMFHVNMDVHEYAPFGETWRNYGYRRNSFELIGCNTNINISKEIRNLSNHDFVPFFNNYLNESGISNSIYAPGGPPEIDYIRHSTFDINDGRQSFGILNSLSFILEGLNGTDNFKDSLQQRSEGQKAGMMALIHYCYKNHSRIKSLVEKERTHLLKGETDGWVSIQMEHVQNGSKLRLPVYSYATGCDSVIIVNDYRPAIKSICDVKKPEGYLIPIQLKELVLWTERQQLNTQYYKPKADDLIEQYQIVSMDSIDFERDIIINPVVEVSNIHPKDLRGEYLFVPAKQLKGNLVVIALEPKSELGIVTYPAFNHLIKVGETFPVLRLLHK